MPSLHIHVSCRTVEMKKMVEEFLEIKQWQVLLFTTQHLLAPDDFKAIKASAVWVQSIEAIISNREKELKKERDGIENKFKDARQRFFEEVQSYLKQVENLKKVQLQICM